MKKNTCKNGHAMTPDNIITHGSIRRCKTCRLEKIKPKTHCERGHALTGDNVEIHKNGNDNMYQGCVACKELGPHGVAPYCTRCATPVKFTKKGLLVNQFGGELHTCDIPEDDDLTMPLFYKGSVAFLQEAVDKW